jgi:hypothetical protein
MTFPMEYHIAVRRAVKCPAQRSIPATPALFGVLLLPLLLVCTSPAQINGVPPSVTSPGFGGHAINGTPPSVTSLGRNGYAPPQSGITFSTNVPHNNGHHHHHTAQSDAYYGYVYAVPVPYAVDMSSTDDDDADADYQGGPTVFDRRGSGRDSYVPPSYAGPAHAHAQPAPAGAMQAEDAPASESGAELAPEPPQPPTTLVFKDGQQIEIENYAIVSQTLYDLAPGHPRKIALADLDLPATEKQNDDRGVTFQLPPSAQAN